MNKQLIVNFLWEEVEEKIFKIWNLSEIEYPYLRKWMSQLFFDVLKMIPEGTSLVEPGCLTRALSKIAEQEYQQTCKEDVFLKFLDAKGIAVKEKYQVSFKTNKYGISFIYSFNKIAISKNSVENENVILEFFDFDDLVYALKFIKDFSNPCIEIYRNKKQWILILDKISNVQLSELGSQINKEHVYIEGMYFYGKTGEFLNKIGNY